MTRIREEEEDYHAMLCKHGLCCHAVSSVCLCVCVSITFVNSVKTNKHIFKQFLPSGSRAVLVFSIPNGMAIFRREPFLTEASNAGGVGRNRDSEHISGLTVWC